jgi:hypothetical protein
MFAFLSQLEIFGVIKQPVSSMTSKQDNLNDIKNSNNIWDFLSNSCGPIEAFKGKSKMPQQTII